MTPSDIQEKEELNQLIEETTTVLGGTDSTYIEFLQLLNKNQKLLMTRRLLPGQMVFFKYKPIGEKYEKRDTYTYYDKYPLVMVTESKREWFAGINVHFIDPVHRKFLFDAIMRNIPVIKSGLEWRNRLRLNYDRLVARRIFKFFKPCYRAYSWKGMRRRPVIVPFNLWEEMVMAENMRFIEKKRHTVYRNSYLNAIRNGK